MNLCKETEVITDLLLSRLQRLDRRHLFQHDLTRQYLRLTNRTHLQEWTRQLGRLERIDGHPEEAKRSEQWITNPCYRDLQKKDQPIRVLMEKLSLITQMECLDTQRKSQNNRRIQL